MATSYDLNITQGSRFSVRLEISNEDLSAFNLSGYSSRGYVKFRHSDTGILLDLNPTPVTGLNGISLISGFIDINLSGAQTAGVPVVQGIYDVEIYNSGGFVEKAILGYCNFLPEVTN